MASAKSAARLSLPASTPTTSENRSDNSACGRFFYGRSMEKITGKKGGGGNSRTPRESPDSLQSIATAKILLAL
ncbi:hypothetical protein FNN14_21290, partial [Cronobacter sakazakii]